MGYQDLTASHSSRKTSSRVSERPRLKEERQGAIANPAHPPVVCVHAHEHTKEAKAFMAH